MVAVDDAADCGQLLRLLGETQAGVPLWRRQRPCVLADAAHFTPDAAQPDRGTLAVRRAPLFSSLYILLHRNASLPQGRNALVFPVVLPACAQSTVSQHCESMLCRWLSSTPAWGWHLGAWRNIALFTGNQMST